jgi:predicted MFS family arabinose efflux permease
MQPATVEWPTPDEHESLVTELEHELRDYRPATLGALLAATALLRVAAVGTGFAIGQLLVDIGGRGTNEITIGLISALQGVTEMVFAPFLARLADRFGRTRVLVGGPLIGTVAVTLCALAVDPKQLGGARLLEGIGAAAFVPVALGTVAAATASDRVVRAGASGGFEAATLAGYAGGFGLGGFAWAAFHRQAFVLFAGLYLLSALICLLLVPRVPPLPVSPLRNVLRAVLGHGPIRVFLPGWLAVFGLIGAFAAHLPPLLRRPAVADQTLVHHFDPRIIGAILVGWIVLFLVGILLWTPFLARRGPVSIMRRAIPGAWLILAALTALNHTSLSFAPFWLPFLILGIVWLAGFGPAAITYLADCSETLAADRSALMSFYTVTLAGGGALGALLGGVVARNLYLDGLVLLALGFSLVTFVSLIFVARYSGAAGAPAEGGRPLPTAAAG